MKILLVCAAGMSTSLVVNKMKAALTPDQQDWVIEAHPIENLDYLIDQFDVVLLGPQVSFKLKRIKQRFEDTGKPIDVIQSVDYSLGNGKNIINQAIKLYEGAK